jgi:hypothetical protein
MANSKQKGNRGERECVKLLKEYWDDDSFMKSPESGGLATVLEGLGAPMDIAGRLAGDVMVPPDFPFCVESKLYKEINLWSVITNPERCDIRTWWEQCKVDAVRADKIPLLTFREDRKKRYVMLSTIAVTTLFLDMGEPLDGFDCGNLRTTFETDGEFEEVVILTWADFVRIFPKDKLL